MRRWGRIAAWAALAVAVAGGAWGAIFWLRYPKVPDPQKISAQEAIGFMASSDFNRMTSGHRTRFILAVLDKQRHDLSFEQLVALMIDPSQDQVRQQMAINIKRLANASQLGGKLFELYLDKFYALPVWRRKLYLTTFAFAQEGKFGPQAVKYDLPTADNFMTKMDQFAHRTPRGQALSVQFLMDLNEHRKSMGLGVK